MPDAETQSEALLTAFSSDAILVRQLAEASLGLEKLRDSNLDWSHVGFSTAIDDNTQAHGGAYETLSGQQVNASENANHSEANQAGTDLSPDSTASDNEDPKISAQEVANVLYVPYGSSPPHEVWTGLAHNRLDQTVEDHELSDFWNNVSQIPQDGRIDLIPKATDNLEAKKTKAFCKKLDEEGGDFWIKDFDSSGRVRHYHYDHSLCAIHRHNREAFARGETRDISSLGWIEPHRPDEDSFDVPPAVWPKTEQAYRDRHWKSGVAVPQAPWQRLMFVYAVPGDEVGIPTWDRVMAVLTLEQQASLSKRRKWSQYIRLGEILTYHHLGQTDSSRSHDVSVDPFLGKHTTKYQSSHRYWTILVLKPAFLHPQMDKDFMTDLQDSQVPSKTMESTVLDLIADTLRHVDMDWTQLCQHTERILSASEKVFNSAFDDSSLFDDDDFSSSRKYTWLIISLGEFEAAISANIHTWKEYEAECLMPYLNDESEISPLERRSIKQTLSKIAKIVQNLQRTKEQLVRQRNMSVDLRDGVRQFRSQSTRMLTCIPALRRKLGA
ncbi:MAG: hypothetical protein LQ348_003949 [Seirophora lacunosa]|nr:MAG: hypothetical protein LQ348_003949 [Seirophora lacunosa]